MRKIVLGSLALSSALLLFACTKSITPKPADTSMKPAGTSMFANAKVSTLSFTGVAKQNPDSILVHKNAGSDEKSYEPEYIAVSNDSKTAWVNLQENNAIAVVDLEKGKITKVVGLGFKDHGKVGNGLDASDKDNGINISTYKNLYGIYQPDGIAYYNIDGKDYIFTANEGDDGWVEDIDELDVKDVEFEASVKKAKKMKKSSQAGRLGIYKFLGDSDNNGKYEAVYAFGGRSFSIFNGNVEEVFESGDSIELNVAISDYVQSDHKRFNLDNDDEEMKAEKESDNSGPSPEGIEVGKVGDRYYAFVVLEKISGVMTYDVTNPAEAEFVSYINTRDFEAGKETMENNEAGDLGPEGVKFIAADKSPINQPLLFVSNEVSGTAVVYEVANDGTLSVTARYTTDAPFDGGGAEIVNYNPKNKMLVVANGYHKSLDLVDLSKITAGTINEYYYPGANDSTHTRITMKELSGKISDLTFSDVTSVDVHPDGDFLAIAVPAVESTDNGNVIILTNKGEYVTHYEVGALPDMVKFTPDGKKILVANEGEPKKKVINNKEVHGYVDNTPGIDPEGTISVIDLAL